MPVIYECDGCKKREYAIDLKGEFEKPMAWYQRADEQGTQLACSIECVHLIADKTGKTGVISPL